VRKGGNSESPAGYWDRLPFCILISNYKK